MWDNQSKVIEKHRHKNDPQDSKGKKKKNQTISRFRSKLQIKVSEIKGRSNYYSPT